jgi:hypothetical protein
MVSEIIVALIGGLVTLSGVLIANSRAQAVTDTRLDELTREVRSITTLPAVFPCWKSR